MPKKNKIDGTPPHVKYTKYGFPYVDVDNFLSSEEGKRLLERLKSIGCIPTDKSGLDSKKTENKLS